MHAYHYADYMKSEQWTERRSRRLEIAKHACEHCGETGALHVHHLTYKRLGNEDDADLMALCVRCHDVIEAIIRDREHERTGPVENLRRFTHRRLRLAGRPMKDGPFHMSKTLTRWAKKAQPVVRAYKREKAIR